MSFLVLGPEAAAQRVTELGGRPFHARIVRREVFERGVLDYDAMTGLPQALRARLAEELPLLVGTEVARTASRDGAVKVLIGFADGANVETVHIPSHRPDRGATLCVSSQVGCPVGCPFCASGRDGLVRNLTSGEILEQFLRGRAVGPLSRAVVMGIGEPLLNITAVEEALEIVRTELGIGARRITVSTIGFPDRLRRLADRSPHFQLAISLHSPFDAERAELVPAMAGVPVEDVLAAGDHWFTATGREVTYEYVLLGEVNDTPDHAARLAERLRGRRATVNLIPYNAVPGSPHHSPVHGRPDDFRATLEAAGIVATIRWSRGAASDAACGQLRLRHA